MKYLGFRPFSAVQSSTCLHKNHLFSAIFLAKSVFSYGSSSFCQNVLVFLNLYVIWPFVNGLLWNFFCIQNMDFVVSDVGRLFSN